MKRWWMVAACAAGLGGPINASEPHDDEKPEADVAMQVAEKLGDDMVKLAAELQAAVEAGEITREEMEQQLLDAAMRQIAEQHQRRQVERRPAPPAELIFDPADAEEKFNTWLDAIATGVDPDRNRWSGFARLHSRQSMARNFGQEDVGRPLAIALAHAITTDQRFARPGEPRRLALLALCSASLDEVELRDRTVRELLINQLKQSDGPVVRAIASSLKSVPEDQRALWYPPLAEHLRAETYERFIIGCDGISALGAIAANDRAFLLEVVQDLRAASKPLAESTYLDPFVRSGMSYQYWPRSLVRSKAVQTLLTTAIDHEQVIADLRAVTGRARLDVATGIAAAFCGFNAIDGPDWKPGVREQAFDLLDEILADPTAKVIVIDPAAAFWADVDFRRYGTSILSDLTMTMQFMDHDRELNRLAMRSALRAAYHHGDAKLIESVTDTARRFAPQVIEEVRQEPHTVRAGTDLVQLAVKLRAAVERGEMTQEQMDRRLEEAAYERIRTP
jgi:hypothetical protein